MTSSGKWQSGVLGLMFCLSVAEENKRGREYLLPNHAHNSHHVMQTPIQLPSQL